MTAFWKWLLGWEAATGNAPGKGYSGWGFRFVAEYPNWVKLALMAVLAGMVYLTVRSYRREGEASRRVKAVLGAIRIAVILLVMAIVLQPAIVLRYVRGLTSTVVVLMDDSQSMSFKDRYAEANVGDLRGRLVTDLGAEAGELGEWTRTRIARKELVAPLARLSADHPLVFMRFSTSRPAGSGESYTREMGQLDLVQAEGAQAAAPDAAERIEKILAGLDASGYSSNQAAGLRGSLDLTQGQRLAAVVQVGDGQMTMQGAGSAISGAMEYARDRGVQVYSVLVGDPTPPRSIAVTGLQAPREARRGAEVEFTASLSQRNMGGQTVTVKLQRRKLKEEKWGNDLLSSAVVLDKPASDANGASRNMQSVVLRTKPDELGDFEYRAVVEARPGEVNPADSFAAASVRVVEEKIRVLLISGGAGKEFQYLRNYFLRVQDDFLVSVWQQNADANVNQSASTGMKLERLPKELDDLIGVPGNKDKPGYNAVILYDPQHTEGGFDKHFVEDLLKPFVQKHHGGLCYIAGHKYTDSVLGGDPAFGALRDMMAVTIAPDSMTDLSRIGDIKPESWQVRMTTYGLDHPITRLGFTAEDSPDLWALLPGIYWSHPVAKAKAGARVLAVSSDPMFRSSRNEAMPLIAVQAYGRGSVLYVGFDETWRWSIVKDALYHRNFWSNVVRYLASLQARRFTITTGGTRFTVGEPLTVDMEAYDESYQPLKTDSVDVEMTDALTGEAVRKLTLKVVDANVGGQFKTTFVADRTGQFQLTAGLASGDPNEPTESKQIEVELPQAEFLRVEADPGTLKSMAWPTDKFMDITQAGRLSEIPPGRGTSARDVPLYLWDTNLMLMLIVVLLGVEWILRKKYNMA